MTAAESAWAATFQAPRAGLARLGPAEDPWALWARGVLLQAGGDYAAAFGLWEPLTAAGDELAGLAAARMASGLRQLDEHAAAVAWDDLAQAAPGRAVTDGLIGRAADAVGIGDAATAAEFLAQARRLVGHPRDQIRVAWVACEIELLTGHAAAAAAEADRALETARHLSWPRHQAKSALFLGASLRHSEPERAIPLLHEVASQAEQLSLRPLLWPAVLVLGDAATDSERRCAGRAVRVIESRLPAGVGSRWVVRADVAQLRANS